MQPVSSATDYFLTIGGGYNRSGNQASLEANVVFFQQVLSDKHREPRRHDIYFADGHDPADDLQIVAEKPAKSRLALRLILLASFRIVAAARCTVTYLKSPRRRDCRALNWH